MASDVFISFKNLDAAGSPTRDASLAKEVYDSLTGKGLGVFLSTESLEQLGESNYKRAIDDALDAASIVVAVGTSVENLNSNWVRYEWDSFYNDILSGIKPEGKVFTYIEGLLPRQLPRSLRQTETFIHSSESLQHLCGFVAQAVGQRHPHPAISPLPLEAVPGPEPSPAAVRAPRLDVFLSYAAEDEPYANALREAVEQTGFGVSKRLKLVPGADWEGQVARAIDDCAYFIPIISENTEKREQGFFRKEWRLASERALSVSPDRPFILPVYVGDLEHPEYIPLDFKRIQSVRMEGLTVPQELVDFFHRQAEK
jgi:TIR domain